jgi:hypothetical protein
MKALVIPLMLAASITTAHANVWALASESRDIRVEVRLDSLNPRYIQGHSTLGLLTKWVNKSSGLTSFDWRYVRFDHCERGAGDLFLVTLNGETLRTDQFVLNGGTHASNLADTLCEVYDIAKDMVRERL